MLRPFKGTTFPYDPSFIPAPLVPEIVPMSMPCMINLILHLCIFKTPTCRRFMSAKVGSLCAFKMRKGVKARSAN